MVSVRASILMISSSLDGRKIQKSCLLANVNVDGKHLRQITKINIQQRLMKKTGSRNVGKENGGCFSCSYDRVGRAGKPFVFLYYVKGTWLIYLG